VPVSLNFEIEVRAAKLVFVSR